MLILWFKFTFEFIRKKHRRRMRIIPETESVVVIWERRLFYCDIQTVISCWYLLSQSLAFGNWVSRGLQITTDRSQMWGSWKFVFFPLRGWNCSTLNCRIVAPSKKPQATLCYLWDRLQSVFLHEKPEPNMTTISAVTWFLRGGRIGVTF